MILAKSELKKDFMQNKMNLGADGIEIQLLDEMIDKQAGIYKTASEVYDLDATKEISVYVVHAPILTHFGMPDMNIEDVLTKDRSVLLEQVCFIANYYGEQQGHSVDVIFHTELGVDKFHKVGDVEDQLISIIGCMLLKYPHINILIENITPIRDRGVPLRLSDNFKFDNVDIVKYLRKELCTERIGTVLDTCHVEITRMVMEKIYTLFPDKTPEDYSLESYMKENADLISVIHLSKTLGNGYDKGTHGQPFTKVDEDYEYIRNFLSLYKKYGCTGKITLEVAETDYSISNGFKVSNEMLRELLAECK